MKTYPLESLRQNALIKILTSTEILPARLGPRTNDSYINDGPIFHFCKPSPSYLQEVELEVIGNTSDPYLRSARYYLEYCRKYLTNRQAEYHHLNFPVILLCQMGPLFMISVGVLPNMPIVESIATISLHTNSTNENGMKAGACVLGALRIAVQGISRAYENGHPANSNNSNSVSGDTQAAIKFTYTFQLESKRVFFACTKDTQKSIYVKFTMRYSTAAHNALTCYAPPVLAVMRYYQWLMVVMGDVPDRYMTMADWIVSPAMPLSIFKTRYIYSQERSLCWICSR
ncbi:hypothetical protein CPB83DRAFT_771625 [Crepidotus variabilis]|uniref:Uncharacterized protein n=1 Tax=Crepidotus variabilis TaxID=179855 RepID=A0A9P6EA81_9AGAR|nr:hypothetical protein CPB83DRAFT_771625 [Crepidotus variabilis]